MSQAWEQVSASIERFCLTALSEMMEQDATKLCGPRFSNREWEPCHGWGKTQGKIGFHGGEVTLAPPRAWP